MSKESTIIVSDSTKKVPDEKIAKHHRSARFMSYIISHSNTNQNSKDEQTIEIIDRKNNSNSND